jgi:anti-anti-sigma regulatory factor
MAAPAAGVPSPSATRPPRPATSRVGSEEYHSGSLPAPQDAAVLYASNHAAAAAALLQAEIKDPVGRNNKQAWLMLFDLHQATSNRAEFDALSMLFTVKFEQSPPAWLEGAGGDAADPRRNQNRERKDFFALKSPAGGEVPAADIEKFLAFAESQGSVRLDVAKITAIGPEEAALFASALTHLRQKKLPMWFNHLDALEKLLRAAFNEKAVEEQKPYWQLLFEILILQGKTQEFEDLGLEYAVAFEVSPPSWEVYVNEVAAAAQKSPGADAKAAAEPAPAESYSLKGVLSAASSNQMAELNDYAAARSEVTVDMGKVLRVDFGFTAAFFDVVKAIQLAGKRVILTNLNELNAALLEAMGVNRYAILVRHK